MNKDDEAIVNVTIANFKKKCKVVGLPYYSSITISWELCTNRLQ